MLNFCVTTCLNVRYFPLLCTFKLAVELGCCLLLAALFCRVLSFEFVAADVVVMLLLVSTNLCSVLLVSGKT